MVLTLDAVSKEVSLRVGDSNRERLKDINRYIGDVVTEITMMLRRGLVYETATPTVTANVANLPADCAAILRIYNGSTVYESVDNDTFRNRSTSGSVVPTVQVQEGTPWTLNFLNYTSGVTVSVDYIKITGDVTLAPDYYKRLITMGAMSLYHLDRSTIEKYREYNSKYKEMKNEFIQYQVYNTGMDRQMKSLRQLNAEDNQGNFIAGNNNDYFNPGGGY
jgi:hypothetical protein